MQYAVNHLGFAPHSVVLFAWSIGGYAASYAACSYPDVKHVVSKITTRRDLLVVAVVVVVVK